jgi:glutamine amidotransferase
VGAFDAGMAHLRELDLVSVLEQKVMKDKVPILGICLGLQLFSKRSEEGVKPGFGWIDAETVRFRFGKDTGGLKIPHMGWNTVQKTGRGRLFRDLPEGERFYFVHSYHLRCVDHGDEALTTRYGYDFPSAIEHGNIYGVQFHPEKSHKFGMRLLKNFLELI